MIFRQNLEINNLNKLLKDSMIVKELNLVSQPLIMRIMVIFLETYIRSVDAL